MSLRDYKITQGDIETKGVVAVPDVMSGDPQANKRIFDRLIREAVAKKFNDLVDELVENGVEVILKRGDDSIRYIRLNADNVLEVSTDGIEYVATDSSAKTAESYAKGGTGTREGEDTDNARYYAVLAASAAGGGVVAVDGEVPDETGNVPLQRANDRLSLLEYMAQNNDYVAPITTDDNNPTAILVDDDGNAILANWKYKEV